MCGRCLKARASQHALADCGATLIICPASILQQWQSEIAKHTAPGALKVITYLGQNKTVLEPVPSTAGPAGSAGRLESGEFESGVQQQQGGGAAKRKGKHSGQGVVSAEDLAAADVVLTTYDVLQRDLHHASDPDQAVKMLRTSKRYEVGGFTEQVWGKHAWVVALRSLARWQQQCCVITHTHSWHVESYLPVVLVCSHSCFDPGKVHEHQQAGQVVRDQENITKL